MFQVKLLYSETIGRKTEVRSAIFLSMPSALRFSKKRGITAIRMMRISDQVILMERYGGRGLGA